MVRRHHVYPDAAWLSVSGGDHDVFVAPVELEGFARIENQGDKGRRRQRLLLPLPGSDVALHIVIGAGIAFATNLFIEQFC